MSGGPGVIIAGAAETDQVGKLPGHSTLALHVEAALNAVRDAGPAAHEPASGANTGR